MGWQKTSGERIAVCLLSCCIVAVAGGTDWTVEQVIVTPIDHVAVPAPEAGVLQELLVVEGEEVHQEQPLGQLDDRDASLAAKLAEAAHATRKHQAADTSEIELAKKRLELGRQALREQEKLLEIAVRKATNDIRVRAAEKSHEVAENELERARQAKRAYADAVSASEIDGLRLAMEKAGLEAEQAAFDQRIDQLKADAERETLTTRELGMEEAQLQIEQALSTQQLAQLQTKESQVEVDRARQRAERRRILSPIDGHVSELMHRAGEWVEPGESIARVVRLDRLRAEGFVSIDRLSELQVGAPVTVVVDVGAGAEREFSGEIAFISKEVDPVNQQVSIWFDFDNQELVALPGMRAHVRLQSEETE